MNYFTLLLLAFKSTLIKDSGKAAQRNYGIVVANTENNGGGGVTIKNH